MHERTPHTEIGILYKKSIKKNEKRVPLTVTKNYSQIFDFRSAHTFFYSSIQEYA